jgi:hypothetical protein
MQPDPTRPDLASCPGYYDSLRSLRAAVDVHDAGSSWDCAGAVCRPAVEQWVRPQTLVSKSQWYAAALHSVSARGLQCRGKHSLTHRRMNT